MGPGIAGITCKCPPGKAERGLSYLLVANPTEVDALRINPGEERVGTRIAWIDPSRLFEISGRRFVVFGRRGPDMRHGAHHEPPGVEARRCFRTVTRCFCSEKKRLNGRHDTF